MAEVSEILDLIMKSKKILITPSCPPDGDSIGSALAVYKVLQKLGKEATVVCADPVPGTLQFLPQSEQINDELKGSSDFIVTLDCNDAQVDKLRYEIVDNKVNIIITPKNGEFSEKHVAFKPSGPDYDLIIAVDTADVNQLGHIYQQNTDFFFKVPIINIDHHISNTNFGKVNYVDTSASSATEILFGLLSQLEQKTNQTLIDDKVATYLLTGIITDTGSFQNPNTTPKSLEVSAALVERGAAQQDIIKHVFRTKNLSTLKLWGEVLSKIQTDDTHKIVWSTMTKEDLVKTHATTEEISGMIDDMLINAPGAEIVFIIKETDENISCSMRSTLPAANVSEVAEHFGGGGHIQAAGFKIQGKSFQEAEQEIVAYIKDYQSKRLGLTQDPAQQVSSNTQPTPAPAPRVEEKPMEKFNEGLIGLSGSDNPLPIPEVKSAPVEQVPLSQAPTPQTTQAPAPQPRENTPVVKPTPIQNNAPQQPGEGEERKKKRRRRRRRNRSDDTQSQTQTPPSASPQRMPEVAAKPQPQREEKPQAAPQTPVQTKQPEKQPEVEAPIQQTTPPAEQTAAPAAKPPQNEQTTQPQPEEPKKPSFDPFNPPNPEESDILAALSKL